MQTLGPYRIKRTIALGGMGEVFLAALQRAGGFEKQVALKCVLPRFVEDSTFKELFEQEARLAAVLNHRNIVQVFDFGYDQRRAWLAMEFVDGVDVKAVYDRLAQPLPLGISLNIGISVARALHYAHRAVDPRGQPLHIVHRDVSPQNILLSYEGDIKLADFGLAFAAARDREDDGTLKGKYAYMSPEQVKGQALDGRSDQFSLGVVLYEICSGHRAFFRDGGPANILTHVARGQPLERLCDVAPTLDSAISTVIERAMAPNRTDRYPDAGAFADALSAAAKAAQISLEVPKLGPWLVEQAPRRIMMPLSEPSLAAEGTEVADEPILASWPVSKMDDIVERTVSVARDIAINPESTTADFPFPSKSQSASTVTAIDGTIIGEGKPSIEVSEQAKDIDARPGKRQRKNTFAAPVVGLVALVACLGGYWLFVSDVGLTASGGMAIDVADSTKIPSVVFPMTVDASSRIIRPSPPLDEVDMQGLDRLTDAAQTNRLQLDASTDVAFSDASNGMDIPHRYFDGSVTKSTSIEANGPIKSTGIGAAKPRRLNSFAGSKRGRPIESRTSGTSSKQVEMNTPQKTAGRVSRPSPAPIQPPSKRPIDATLVPQKIPDAGVTQPQQEKVPVIEGVRFRVSSQVGSVRSRAKMLGRGWRRLGPAGEMVKVVDVSGAIIRMRLRSRSGRFDATIHAKPNGRLSIDGRSMGSTPMASIPLQEGVQKLTMTFPSGSVMTVRLELSQ